MNYMDWERDAIQELKLFQMGSDLVCPGCQRRIRLGEVLWQSVVCPCGEKLINGEVGGRDE